MSTMMVTGILARGEHRKFTELMFAVSHIRAFREICPFSSWGSGNVDSHVETLVVIYICLPFSWPLGLRPGSLGRKVGEGIWLPRPGNGCCNIEDIPLCAKIRTQAPDPVSNGIIPLSSYLPRIFCVYLLVYSFMYLLIFIYCIHVYCVGILPKCMCLRTCGSWFSSQHMGPGWDPLELAAGTFVRWATSSA